MQTTKRVLLKDVLLETKDGEWGKADPASSLREMMVIRGADFDDVRYGDLNAVPRRFIPVKAAERKALQPDDILIETAGGTVGRPTGRTLFITHEILRSARIPVTCASFSRFLRPDPEAIYPGYLYWYLQYLYNTKQLDAYQVQHTGVARFQYTDFARSIEIPLPPMHVQRRIADVLGAFDEKIKINRDTNKTLEKMAMTLYQYWLVDFGPFQDCEFVESELGLIPSEWKIKTLGEIADVKGGKRLPKGKTVQELRTDYPYIRVKDFYDGTVNLHGLGFIDHEAHEATCRYIIQSNDVYISIAGTIGLTGMVPVELSGAHLTENAAKITNFKSDLTAYVVMTYLKSRAGQGEIYSRVVGSTQPKLPLYAIREIPFISAPEEVVRELGFKLHNLYRLKEQYQRQSFTLQEMRDHILPRLLSGKLDLNEVAII